MMREPLSDTGGSLSLLGIANIWYIMMLAVRAREAVQRSRGLRPHERKPRQRKGRRSH